MVLLTSDEPEVLSREAREWRAVWRSTQRLCLGGMLLIGAAVTAGPVLWYGAQYLWDCLGPLLAVLALVLWLAWPHLGRIGAVVAREDEAGQEPRPV